MTRTGLTLRASTACQRYAATTQRSNLSTVMAARRGAPALQAGQDGRWRCVRWHTAVRTLPHGNATGPWRAPCPARAHTCGRA